MLYYTIVLCDSRDVHQFLVCLSTQHELIISCWRPCSRASFTLHFHIGNIVHKQLVPRVKPIIVSSILRKTKIAERAWNEIVILHYYPHSRPSFVPNWSVNEATPSECTHSFSSPHTASWLGPSLCITQEAWSTPWNGRSYTRWLIQFLFYPQGIST